MTGRPMTPRQRIREALVEFDTLETSLASRAQYNHAEQVKAVRALLYAALSEDDAVIQRQRIGDTLSTLDGLEKSLSRRAQYNHAKIVASIRRWLNAALGERGTNEMPSVDDDGVPS